MLVYFSLLDKNPGWVQMAMNTTITLRTTRLLSTSRPDPMVMETPLECLVYFIKSLDFERFLFM
jgi:hypothetical protein